MAKTPDFVQYAASIVPSERQLQWQETEFYAFIHFGINTFTDSEWGNGNEDPALFDPTDLNCRQWANICKHAGMRGMILTAKHHDGFCLWPSAFTDHSVKSAPWKNGKGDVVAECAAACREFGLKFGVYLSPWDRHEATYGTGAAYNTFYKNQLRELLTGYGPLFCVWLDGACGEGANGRKQSYDWEGYYALIRELQPNAAICVTGPDVRWCGNEAGVCRSSEWSVVPYYHSNAARIAAASQQSADKPPKKINPAEPDLGSRRVIKHCSHLIWYPAEVDVSIRKGWFYHTSEDHTVKPLSKLMELYYRSVGANAALLLNIPPTPEGKLHQQDADALLNMGAQLQIDFNENLADGATLTADRCLDAAHDGSAALSPDPNRYWHSGEEPDGATLTLDLGEAFDIDKIVLGEHIRTGQQIEAFTLYVEQGGKWKRLMKGTVIGYKRICRFEEVRAQQFKLVIEQARCFATLSKFEAY